MTFSPEINFAAARLTCVTAANRDQRAPLKLLTLIAYIIEDWSRATVDEERKVDI